MEKKTILLVEDDSNDEVLMVRALKQNNILNDIIIARDGAEALDYLFCRGDYADRDSRLRPQIILLDL